MTQVCIDVYHLTPSVGTRLHLPLLMLWVLYD